MSGIKKNIGKGLGKGAGMIGDVAGKTLNKLLGEIATEIVKESGIADLAVAAVVDAGKMISGHERLGLDRLKPKLLKAPMMKDLGLS